MTARMIWFDFGGVLSPPLSVLFDRYHERTGIEPQLLKWAMAEVARDMDLEPLAPVELGLISETEWVRQMHEVIRSTHPEIDLSRSEAAFGRQWFEGHLANAGLRQALVNLSGDGFRVGLLTNNVPEWEPHWRRMLDLDGVVDDVVDSCRVGLRKPDPEIFALAARRNEVAASSCLLIDDLVENCEAAIAAGWAAIQHVDNASTLELLKHLKH